MFEYLHFFGDTMDTVYCELCLSGTNQFRENCADESLQPFLDRFCDLIFQVNLQMRSVRQQCCNEFFFINIYRMVLYQLIVFALIAGIQ